MLITGGTGSLGRAILEHQDILKEHGIDRIRIFSRDEQKQDKLEKNYKGEIELQCVLGDVCTQGRLHYSLSEVEYVIHAAAIKIQPKMELDVPTGQRTNIQGTTNVVESILKWNQVGKKCKSAIFCGTDKSCFPVNSYGVSKLAAENVWLWANLVQKDTSFGVTRYGNVYGSAGSVVELWRDQALHFNSLTLTQTDMTRFFITLENASRFVLKCLFDNQKKVMAPVMKGALMTRVAESVLAHHEETSTPSFRSIGIRAGEKVHEQILEDGPSSKEVEQFSDDELQEMYESWNQNHSL